MIKSNLPVILLKNLVLLPYEEVRVELKSSTSKKVTEISKLYHDSEVLVVCPLNSLEEKPDASDLPKIGVVGKIKSIIELPNGNQRIIITGLYRVKVISYVNYSNEEDILDSIINKIEDNDSEIETMAYSRKLISELEGYVSKNPFITNSIMSEIKNEITLDKLTDLVGSFLTLSFDKKLSLMLDASPISRSKTLIKELAIEMAVLDLEGHIETQIKKNLDDSEKEYILKEKLKVIKDELGESLSKAEDVIDLRDKINNGKYPSRIKEKLLSELDRYDASSEMSPDAGIIRNYIDYLLNIPWKVSTRDEKDLVKIEKKLDSSHYGLKEAKNRIIEYIAVKSISEDVNTPIICLVGPPGVGKTTFAESISNALNRNFVKISLGGMSDSSELVGHRRAYIGSNPGRIITSLIKCGSNNPVFLLDEVDKLKKDYKGDPASTLLDILDPSQNNRFTDIYVDEEFDLSKVLFILTANDINTIPLALLDRLEIISLNGYSPKEKLFICENYLIVNMLKKHGLKNNVIKFETEALEYLIENYTNESGVRELERLLSKIVRKIITEHIKSSRKIVSVRIKKEDINRYLDKELIVSSKSREITHTGVIHAVATSSHGGTIIDIECSRFKGSGKYTFTGSLGEVAKESIEVAISYIKSNATKFNIDDKVFNENDLHIHFTESGVLKDGPSAGSSIVSAILSLIKDVYIPDNISMSGEMSLKGDILIVGGIKDKVIAAKKNNITKLYIPKDNMNEIESLDDDLKDNIKFIPVSNYEDIYIDLFQK